MTGLLPECLKHTLVPRSEEHVRVGHICWGIEIVRFVVLFVELVVVFDVVLEDEEDEVVAWLSWGLLDEELDELVVVC